MTTCSCGRISVGGEATDLRNWHPDCGEHGLASEWYRSPAQVSKREVQNERLRDLQAKASAARRRARETSE